MVEDGFIVQISIHPPHVGRTAPRLEFLGNEGISIHPPPVGRDELDAAQREYERISIHPPRVGEGPQHLPQHPGAVFISIRPPREGRDTGGDVLHVDVAISIHPPRVGRDMSVEECVANMDISIHPPRVGRDVHNRRSAHVTVISIHPPRVGRDITCWHSLWLRFRFQSTLPVWGGTGLGIWDYSNLPGFQSTLPVRGGTQSGLPDHQQQEISIHPPRVGRDMQDLSKKVAVYISIHPPRVGRDRRGTELQCHQAHFNPPSPCGEGRGFIQL